MINKVKDFADWATIIMNTLMFVDWIYQKAKKKTPKPPKRTKRKKRK